MQNIKSEAFALAENIAPSSLLIPLPCLPVVGWLGCNFNTSLLPHFGSRLKGATGCPVRYGRKPPH